MFGIKEIKETLKQIQESKSEEDWIRARMEDQLDDIRADIKNIKTSINPNGLLNELKERIGECERILKEFKEMIVLYKKSLPKRRVSKKIVKTSK